MWNIRYRVLPFPGAGGESSAATRLKGSYLSTRSAGVSTLQLQFLHVCMQKKNQTSSLSSWFDSIFND